MRIAILDDTHGAYEGSAGVRRLREHPGVDEVRIFTGPFGDPAVLEGFPALVANRERTRFTRELFERLPHLRLLVQTGSHAYHVDLAAARERGVVVAKATGERTTGAAELVYGLAISLMRQIHQSDAGVRQGGWPTPLGLVLDSKTLGVVGFGRIGTQVARLGTAFGMRVLGWSPSLTDERAAAVGADRRDLDDLLAASDVVTVHVALSDGSRGLIDARRLALMRPGAFLINTSRGPIVDEAALVEALASGRLAGAGLDVFDEEPLPADHPLTRLPNTLLTPHVGWPTDQAYEHFASAAASVLIAYLDGGTVPLIDGH